MDIDAPKARYFGNDAQRGMQAKARALWSLLGDDPRYHYHGRFVGRDGTDPESVEAFLALASLQGASISCFVPEDEASTLAATFQSRGFGTDEWRILLGGDSAISVSRGIVRDLKLPPDLRLAELTADSPESLIDNFEEEALKHGVLPPAFAALTGVSRPGIALMALDTDGKVAAMSGAVMQYHADNPRRDVAWWGMLATRDDQRGRGLARLLGAQVVVDMVDRYGTGKFFTGVRHDNAVSQHICRSLGVTDAGMCGIAASDPAFGMITK